MSVDVAIDARLTSHASAGMQAYTRELRDRLPRVAPDLHVTAFGGGDNFDAAEQLSMPLWIARYQPGLVHYTTPFAPVVQPRPFVVTIHDLIEMRYPQYSKPAASLYYRTVVGSLARRARHVICSDERAVHEVVSLLRVRRERVRVVPLGVGESYLSAPARRLRAGRPYFLYVGNHRPHKDLETLFAAWARLPDDARADLYLTGSSELPPSARRGGAEVRMLGSLTEERLIDAYQGALAVVQPSLFEGFGLPVLEASALGTPVIAAEASVPAALLDLTERFPARDVDRLRAALERAVREPAAMRELGSRAQAIARTHTWDACAAGVAAVYREALAGRRP